MKYKTEKNRKFNLNSAASRLKLEKSCEVNTNLYMVDKLFHSFVPDNSNNFISFDEFFIILFIISW